MDFQSLSQQQTPQIRNYNSSSFPTFGDRTNPHRSHHQNHRNTNSVNGNFNTHKNRHNSEYNYKRTRLKQNKSRNTTNINRNALTAKPKIHFDNQSMRSNMQRNENIQRHPSIDNKSVHSHMTRNTNNFNPHNRSQYIPKERNNINSEFERNNSRNGNQNNHSYLSSENLQKLNESYECEPEYPRGTNNANNNNKSDPFNFQWKQQQIESENMRRCHSEQIDNFEQIEHASHTDIFVEDSDMYVHHQKRDNYNDCQLRKTVNINSKYGKREDIEYSLMALEDIKKELSALKQDITSRQSESEMNKKRFEKGLCSESNINDYNNSQETFHNHRKRKFDNAMENTHGNNHEIMNKRRRIDLKFSG